MFLNMLLWQEGGGEPPKGSLGWAIDTHFGSMEALIQKMNAEGAALQGSGWVVSFSVGKYPTRPFPYLYAWFLRDESGSAIFVYFI